jgi:hypothetical protein
MGIFWNPEACGAACEFELQSLLSREKSIDMGGNSRASCPTLHIFSQPTPNTSKGTVKRKKEFVNI